MSHVCEQCGASFAHRRGKDTNRFCSRSCAVQWTRGANHPRFLGRVQHPAGYIRVWAPGHPVANADGYALEHRMVVYDAGISIPHGHHVHHLNGNKTDNRLENLAVLPESDHHKQHVPPGGAVVNQFGTWLVMAADQRRAKKLAAIKHWREKNREHRRAYR
jgi:hypothetical protein